MSTATETIESLVKQDYKYGFYTDVETDSAPPGLSEEQKTLVREVHEFYDLRALAKEGAHLDAVYYCPHSSADACECRKPKLGMIHKAERDLGVQASGSFSSAIATAIWNSPFAPMPIASLCAPATVSAIGSGITRNGPGSPNV